MGVFVEDEELLHIVLDGLPSEMYPFYTAMKTRNEPIGLEDFMFLAMQKKNPSRIIMTLHKNPCNTWLCLALDPNLAQAQVILILHSFSLMLSLIEEEREEDIITLEAEGVAISITEEALTQTQQPSNFHNTTINKTVPHFNLLLDPLARSATRWDTQQLTATT